MQQDILPPPVNAMGPEPTPGPSALEDHVSWAFIRANTLLATGPVLFWGLVLTDITADNTATVMNGVNAAAPHVVELALEITTQYMVPLFLPKPILLQFGLYITFGSTPLSCLVLFTPLPG